ncbi:unnamed protein product [Rotaria sp. Silwood1]|nr:unnamed protein product [Rotaria sp. Silwood1]
MLFPCINTGGLSLFDITSITTTTATTIKAPVCSLQWDSIGTTVAGDARGVAGITSNRLNAPRDIFLDSSNTLFIADYGNNRVQKWLLGAATGTTVAGKKNGVAGRNSDQLSGPTGIVVDPSSNIDVVDSRNHRVQSWLSGAAAGTTIAGKGGSGRRLDQFVFPSSIALDDKSGTIYISDSFNHRVMKYTPGAINGVVVAGGKRAGTATNQLWLPSGIYYDSTSNSVVIANTGANNIVRWPIGANAWTLLAGDKNGKAGSSSTLLRNPLDVTFDNMGNMYVADRNNNRIQFFNAGGTIGRTIAGGNNRANAAPSSLNLPSAVILDDQGHLYARGHADKIATRYRPGACENCGAMTHKRKDCVERPRRLGARFTGTDFAPDEYIQPDINLSWDGKRDRWNGVDINWHQQKIHDEHQRLAEAKKILKAKKLDEEAMAEEQAINETTPNESTDPLVTVAAKPIEHDDKNKSTKKTKIDSDDDEEDEEYKYTDSMDMPGQHVDSKQRISVRNLRIREDTAKYLLNLDAESAYYDPKSRSMRDNPFTGTNKDPSQVPYLGDNFVRYSGEAKDFAKSQIFAWEASDKGVNIHTQADPTKLELLNKEFHEKKNQFIKTVEKQLIERYGGEEYLNSIPRELVVEAQTEQYVEYNRFGKVIKGDQRATIKSKYVEDVYENEHTSVWGSYWKNHRWGYACCHSLLRQSYCTGTIIEDKEIEFQIDEKSDDINEDKPKSLVELHREKLNKKKLQPKSSSTDDDQNSITKKLDKKKVQEAARKIEERDRQAEDIVNVDERKRKYNSLKSDINEHKEPTEEELEAYRLKKHRHDDPMAQFMLNS